MFSIQDEILINQYVQGIQPISALLDWYNLFDADKRRSILIQIWSLVNQARGNEDDVEKARIISGLNPTHTPVRMLLTEKLLFKDRGYKLANLKEQNGN